MRPKSERNKMRDWHKSHAQMEITFNEDSDLWVERLQIRKKYGYRNRAGYIKGWKRVANRSIRKCSKEISNGNDYRKAYELMWRIY